MRYYATSHCQPPADFPEGQRAFQGSEVFSVGGSPTVITWSDDGMPIGAGARLRVSVATDIREVVRLAVASAETGTVFGDLDLRFSYPLQIHELLLDRGNSELARKEGISLRLIEGSRPQWLFWRGPGADINAHSPHLLREETTGELDAALDRLMSLDSLQPFGWLEGCVLDALAAWSGHPRCGGRCQEAMARHFAQFADVTGALAYEDPRNAAVRSRIYGAEGGLPFAVLARFMPLSPWLAIAADFFRDWSEVRSSWHVAETSYTCAYPMAVLALIRPGEGWEQRAADHLLRQCQTLASSEGIWLRRSESGDRAEMKNWSRGIAWYLLGLARSLPLLPKNPALEIEFQRAALWVLGHQRADGLWGVYVDEPELDPDTSACAGIGAALAMGCRARLLPDNCLPAAQATLGTLQRHLTPDGFLTGVAQSNKGGENLQRGSHRVMAQFSLGLLLLLRRFAED